MNKTHLEICSSPEWARLVEQELLPWVLGALMIALWHHEPETALHSLRHR